MIRWLILFSVIFLFGCTHSVTKETPTVYTWETKVIAPPLFLYARQPIPVFTHTPEKYAVLSSDEKEELLILLNRELYRTIIDTNKRFDAIAQWIESQKQLYKKEYSDGRKSD